MDGLEGSFTVALIDGQARRVLLYRNLVGAGFTYYHVGPDGFLFGGNLAQLVERVGGAAAAEPRRPSALFPLPLHSRPRHALRELSSARLPGEQLTWDERGLTRTQRHTFADLRETPAAADPARALAGDDGRRS